MWDGFDDVVAQGEDVVDSSSMWDAFGFDDASLNVPQMDFSDYNFDPTLIEDQSGGMSWPALSGPEYGPQAQDFNFTNPMPTGTEDAVGGLPGNPGDSLSPPMADKGFLDGLGGQFTGLFKSLTDLGKNAKAGAPASQSKSTTSSARSALDAIGSLVKDVTTTAQIVKDTKTRLTNMPGDVNAALQKSKAMQQGANLARPGQAAGYANSIPMPLIVGAVLLGGFLLLRGGGHV